MKKLLTVFLCLLLCFTAISFVGCGGDAFDGKYEEATQEEVALYAQQIEENKAETAIDYSTGVQVKMSFSMEYGETSAKGDIDYKMSLVDEQLAMSGNMKMEAAGLDMDCAVYYSDGYFYYAMKTSGVELKIKKQTSIDEVMEEWVDAYAGDISDINLSSLLELVDMYEKMKDEVEVEIDTKFFMEKKDDGVKIKVSISQKETDDTTTNQDYYLMFDASYNLIGVKIDAVYGNQYVHASIAPYSGNVDAPSNKTEYMDFSSILG